MTRMEGCQPAGADLRAARGAGGSRRRGRRGRIRAVQWQQQLGVDAMTPPGRGNDDIPTPGILVQRSWAASLPQRAGRRLGMTDPGVVTVALEVLAPAPAAAFAVQAGTFRNLDNARRMRRVLEIIYGAASIVTRPNSPGLLCVVVGDALTESEARTLAAQIRATRKESAGAYVVRLDAAGVQIAD
jgi:hypothetical protein